MRCANLLLQKRCQWYKIVLEFTRFQKWKLLIALVKICVIDVARVVAVVAVMDGVVVVVDWEIENVTKGTDWVVIYVMRCGLLKDALGMESNTYTSTNKKILCSESTITHDDVVVMMVVH